MKKFLAASTFFSTGSSTCVRKSFSSWPCLNLSRQPLNLVSILAGGIEAHKSGPGLDGRASRISCAVLGILLFKCDMGDARAIGFMKGGIFANSTQYSVVVPNYILNLGVPPLARTQSFPDVFFGQTLFHMHGRNGTNTSTHTYNT